MARSQVHLVGHRTETRLRGFDDSGGAVDLNAMQGVTYS
jgi:hypothetical protein